MLCENMNEQTIHLIGYNPDLFTSFSYKTHQNKPATFSKLRSFLSNGLLPCEQHSSVHGFNWGNFVQSSAVKGFSLRQFRNTSATFSKLCLVEFYLSHHVFLMQYRISLDIGFIAALRKLVILGPKVFMISRVLI